MALTHLRYYAPFNEVLMENRQKNLPPKGPKIDNKWLVFLDQKEIQIAKAIRRAEKIVKCLADEPGKTIKNVAIFCRFPSAVQKFPPFVVVISAIFCQA